MKIKNITANYENVSVLTYTDEIKFNSPSFFYAVDDDVDDSNHYLIQWLENTYKYATIFTVAEILSYFEQNKK